jgi:hypothetical protein
VSAVRVFEGTIAVDDGAIAVRINPPLTPDRVVIYGRDGSQIRLLPMDARRLANLLDAAMSAFDNLAVIA